MRVGRNDPCPCGSGKKYKQCCMIKERAQQVESVMARQSYETLFDQLFAFAQGPEFKVDLISAFNLFWNGNYGAHAPSALDMRDLLRFFDWYVFDYPTWKDRQPVVQVFRESRGAQLSPEEQALLAGWQDSVMSLYRVEEVTAGQYMIVHDLMQGATQQVSDLLLSRLVVRGDLLITRILKGVDEWRTSAVPTLLPPALEQPLVEYMNSAWQSYQETHYAASKKGFLREMSHLYNHYLLQQALTNEEKPTPKTKYYDIRRAAEALRRAREEEQRERVKELIKRGQEERKQAAEEQEEAPALKTTKSGLILPSDRPAPTPRKEEKTTAGGKLLLP